MVKKIISVALLSAFLALGSADVSAADISAFPGATVTNDGNVYTVEVNSDADLIENISFPSSAAVTINGNGHTITRASSYTGVGFSIPDGTTVTIDNVILDGNAPDWAANLAAVNFYAGNDGTRVYGRYPLTIGDNDVSASGSFIDNRGNLTISHSTVKNNLISGAMAIWNRKNLTVANSTFEHNCAKTTYGGAIYSAGNLIVTDSTFTGNNAGSSAALNKAGGAIAANSGTMTVNNSTFTNNTAVTNGGAIMIENANATIGNSTFRGNVVGNDGSAVLMYGTYTRAGVVNFTNNKFIENKTLTYGRDKGNGEGTICTYGRGFETITLDGDEFTDNQASWGSVLSLYDTESPHSVKNISIKNAKSSGNKNSYNTSDSLQIYGVANVIIENYTFENESGLARISNGSSATISNIKTDNSWYVFGMDNVAAENIEVNGREDNDPYFDIFYGNDVAIKNFSAKTYGENGLPEVYGCKTLNLENVDTEGSIYIRNVNTVTADTLNASGTGWDAISFMSVDDLTAKNITTKDYTTDSSALYLSKVTKAEVENVTIANIDASGYSLLEFNSVGEVNVKNLTVDGNTNTNTNDNSIIKIYDNDGSNLPENRSITFENAKITNNKSAGLGGGLMITTRNIPVSFDENSIIIDNESEAGGDDVYIAETDGTPAIITLPNVIWEDKQEEEAIILGSIVISDGGAHYLKVTTIPEENPATGDELNIAILGAVSGIALVSAFIIRTRRSFRR